VTECVVCVCGLEKSENNNEFKNVYALTHKNVDIDAVVSIYLLSKFKNAEPVVNVDKIPNGSKVYIVDMPLTEKLEQKLKDKNCEILAVLDHHSGEGYTCAAEAVAEYVHIPGEYGYLIALAEACDAGAVLSLPTAVRLFHLSGLILAMRYNSISDEEIILELFKILDMYEPLLKEYLRAESLLEATPVVSVSGYKVAIVEKPTPIVNQVLFSDKEIDLIIYKDNYNIGIIRNADNNTPDLTKLKPILEDLLRQKGKPDEIKEWFFHPEGFIAARGTRKHPVSTASVLETHDLLKALLTLARGD